MPYLRDRSPGYLTNFAARLFVRELSWRLDELGLAIGYMPVLTALGDGSAMTQKDLAIEAIVEQPTMAATLARMERDGWIARLPNPQDLRSALVSLTPAALEKMDELMTAITSVNRIATDALTPSEQAQYLELLGKIITALQQADAARPTP